jgi:metal-dependent amidase/aminoacylase/carboxypeptidase family protein
MRATCCPALAPASRRRCAPCGADDFAYYAQRHPGLMMFVGVDSSDQRSASLHQPSFYPPDDAVLRVADTLIAGFAAACELLDQ